MPYKQKAKSKKQLKKSVDNLYKALMKEKCKHQQASKIIGHMKLIIAENRKALCAWRKAYYESNVNLDESYTDNEKTLDVSAALIKRITQE